MKRDFSWPVHAFNEQEFLRFKEKAESMSKTVHKASDGAQRRIYIWGAGIRGCIFLEFCRLLNIDVFGFIDGDENKVNGVISGKYEIYSWDSDVRTQKPFIIVSVEMCEPIVEALESSGFKNGEDYFFVGSVVYPQFEEAFFDNAKTDLMIMGDCIFTQVSFNDTCLESLGNMLCENIVSRGTKLLSVHGMPMRTFYEILRLQILMGNTPRRLLLAVNPVMFNGNKNILPRAQHTPLLKKIQERLPFNDDEFDEYVELTAQRSARFQTDIFVNNAQTAVRRNEEHIVKLKMKQNYMFDLDVNNEGVVYMTHILSLCKEKGIMCIPFLPPINYERGMSFFGDKFKEMCDDNLKILHDIAESFGSKCCDSSYLLESGYFASSDTINELTNHRGREKELRFIAEWLKKENCE